MAVAEALREIFNGETQAQTAERLKAAGLPTHQTMVSAWLRGRIPDFVQLAAIETEYKVPRGWVLYRAGHVDPINVLKRTVSETVGSVQAARLRKELDRMAELLDRLRGDE